MCDLCFQAASSLLVELPLPPSERAASWLERSRALPASRLRLNTAPNACNADTDNDNNNNTADGDDDTFRTVTSDSYLSNKNAELASNLSCSPLVVPELLLPSPPPLDLKTLKVA